MEQEPGSFNKFVKEKSLSLEDQKKLELQDTRLVSEHKAKSLEKDARKHWDLFYKRNETRFFKDRHWTTREFQELLNDSDISKHGKRTIFEIGCGVGNFIFPLIEEKLNFDVIACDLSPRAVEMVRNNSLYDPESMKAFQLDITCTDDLLKEVAENSVDIVTLIFVLSAIHPDKFEHVLKNVAKVLKPGGLILFRDYGLYDMAQLRFKPGNKIGENFHMRQDGTRSYYFSVEFAEKLFLAAGFEIVENSYVHRRTINKKENIDVPRIFIQVKAAKKV